MSEPTLICSAPELASSAQKVALYSHYAATVAGFLGGGLMLMRSREQEKLPHILGAVAAFGVGLAAFYSQWEFNQFLYEHREIVSNAVAVRSGLWAVWATLIVVGLSFLPGFRFKRMKKLALIPLIAFAVLSFGFGSLAEALASASSTLKPSMEMIDQAGGFDAYTMLAKSSAFVSALAFGLPAIVCALLLAGTYVFTQAKKVARRAEENHQSRTGMMTLIAVAVPALAYGAGTFLVAGGGQRIDQAVLLFNVADVISMFFLMCATLSLLGKPENFPKPPKPVKEKPAAETPAPAGEAQPTVLDQQQAYAQAYAQQLYAQQQAYAQYYAQQQAAAANAANGQQLPPAAQNVPAANAVPAAQPPQDPAAAMAAYQQQQAQYYAQQQAYAAYQQQQQAYQQAYVAQQQYAQPQQQVYAQAYAQQQAAYHRQQATSAAAPAAAAHGVRKIAPAAHPSAGTPHGTVKKIGGVRQIKKIR